MSGKGDGLARRGNSQAFRDGHDRIFGRALTRTVRCRDCHRPHVVVTIDTPPTPCPHCARERTPPEVPRGRTLLDAYLALVDSHIMRSAPGIITGVTAAGPEE